MKICPKCKSKYKNSFKYLVFVLIIAFGYVLLTNKEVEYRIYDFGVVKPFAIEDKLKYADRLRENKKFAKAFELYKDVISDETVSDKELGWAYASLGFLYLEENYQDRDYVKACSYFKKAINDYNNPWGYWGLAGYYFYYEKNYDKSFYFLKIASNPVNDLKESYGFLGDHYFFGYGVEKNYEEAICWYKKADEVGTADKHVYKNLGIAYEYGYGVKKDYKKAGWWYVKCGRQGYKNWKEDLDRVMLKEIHEEKI